MSKKSTLVHTTIRYKQKSKIKYFKRFIFSSSSMRNSPHGAVNVYMMFWILHNITGWHKHTIEKKTSLNEIDSFICCDRNLIMYKNRRSKLAPLASSQNLSTALTNNAVASTSTLQTLQQPQLSVQTSSENIDPGVSQAKKRVRFWQEFMSWFLYQLNSSRAKGLFL